MNDDNGIFLRNCWYVAAWDHELLHGAKLARTILEKPVVLFRGESGRYIALDNRCCHRGAPLSMGRVEGDCIRCMYHGMKYDASGVCVQIPGQSRIPESLRVTSYPVQERGHLVWIWLGDPARADPALIVDYPPLHDPAWRGVPAYLHYDANWLLIVDNLSDFAHLAFVHTNTLGGSEEYAYTTKPTAIERLEPTRNPQHPSALELEQLAFDGARRGYVQARVSHPNVVQIHAAAFDKPAGFALGVG